MFKILKTHVMPQTLIIMQLKSCTRRIQPKLSHRTAAAKRGIASMQSVVKKTNRINVRVRSIFFVHSSLLSFT